VKRVNRGTIGVRFERTPGTVYSYWVHNIKKVALGDSLVVSNEYGMSVVFVVRIDKVPSHQAKKFISLKVAPL
jgi:hypothetical protein